MNTLKQLFFISQIERKTLLSIVLFGGVIFIAIFFSFWKMTALVLGIFAVYAAWKYHEKTIIAILAYIPFEPFLLKYVPDDLYLFARYFPEGVVYCLLVSLFFQILFGARPFRFAPFMVPLFCFVVIALISAFFNHTPFIVASLGIRQSIRFVLLAAIIVLIRPKARTVRILLWVTFGIALFEGMLGVLQVFFPAHIDAFFLPEGRRVFGDIQLTGGTHQFWESGQRVFATMGRYDQLGTFLCFAILLCVGVLYERYKMRTSFSIFLWSVMTVGSIALLFTYSRASWFGFFIGLFIIGVLLKRDKRLLCGMGVLGGIVGVFLFFSQINIHSLRDLPSQSIANRFFEAFSLERWRGEYYGLGRMFFFVHTPGSVVASSPFIGVGPGSYGGGTVAALRYTTVYEKLGLPFGIHGTEGYIDNNWFSLWGESGTLGVLFYFLIFFFCVVSAMKLWKCSSDNVTKGIALGFMGASCAVFFQAFLATYLEMRTLMVYFWVFAGLVASEHIKVFYEDRSRP